LWILGIVASISLGIILVMSLFLAPLNRIGWTPTFDETLRILRNNSTVVDRIGEPVIVSDSAWGQSDMPPLDGKNATLVFGIAGCRGQGLVRVQALGHYLLIPRIINIK